MLFLTLTHDAFISSGIGFVVKEKKREIERTVRQSKRHGVVFDPILPTWHKQDLFNKLKNGTK